MLRWLYLFCSSWHCQNIFKDHLLWTVLKVSLLTFLPVFTFWYHLIYLKNVICVQILKICKNWKNILNSKIGLLFFFFFLRCNNPYKEYYTTVNIMTLCRKLGNYLHKNCSLYFLYFLTGDFSVFILNKISLFRSNLLCWSAEHLKEQFSGHPYTLLLGSSSINIL